MRSKLFWTLAVLVLTGLGGVAMPVQAAGKQLPVFSAVDKDQDGSISPTEAVAVPGLTEVLPQLDRDSDGKISKQEYAALQKGSSGAGTSGGETSGGTSGGEMTPGTSGQEP